MKHAAVKSAPIPLAALIDEHDFGEWGFTGTRAGMTEFQSQMIQRILARGKPSIFRHGGAWGADTQAHRIWSWTCKNVKSKAQVWPCDHKRAEFFRAEPRTTVADVLPPLMRNIQIIEVSGFMLATPHKEIEELRSGTWQTIRESIKRFTPILIIWPNSMKLTLHEDGELIRVSYTLK